MVFGERTKKGRQRIQCSQTTKLIALCRVPIEWSRRHFAGNEENRREEKVSSPTDPLLPLSLVQAFVYFNLLIGRMDFIAQYLRVPGRVRSDNSGILLIYSRVNVTTRVKIVTIESFLASHSFYIDRRSFNDRL